jgi:hypothetical protein
MKHTLKLYDFEAKAVRETPTAILLDFGAEKPVWLPKSQVEDNNDGTFTLPKHTAIEKGIA